MIKQGLQLVGDFIVEQLIKTIEVQGHRTTGELQESLSAVIKTESGGYSIEIWGRGYAKYVEQGVPKGAKVSVYALAEWVYNKGIATGEKEVKNIAFAIQAKIFKEGSVQFRKNKKGFVEVTLDANSKAIFQMVLDLFTKEIALSLTNTVSRNERVFKN